MTRAAIVNFIFYDFHFKNRLIPLNVPQIQRRTTEKEKKKKTKLHVFNLVFANVTLHTRLIRKHTKN